MPANGLQNVKVHAKKNVLTLEINLDAIATVSKSRKTMVIASTHGFRHVGKKSNISFNLNVITPIV